MNVQAKFVEKIKTHISYSINFSDFGLVYEILWINTVVPEMIT